LLAKRLVKLRSRLRMDSLREAIGAADQNKAENGRKNMVVFNNYSGAYEAVEKRKLKLVRQKHVVKGQPKQTDYRKSRKKNVKPGRFTNDRIHQLENKSAYVTQ
jgi:hypothetical protein